MPYIRRRGRSRGRDAAKRMIREPVLGKVMRNKRS
jgi:hypothetical protein